MVGERDLSPTIFVMITNHFCQLYRVLLRDPLAGQAATKMVFFLAILVIRYNLAKKCLLFLAV